ncbi:response regulator [Pseudoduganella umbonata]|uniref:CheY-like chemotaxis protein n=1 Tax=Pseudoduganella umbonata TaxID=864828 RepID=A0A4P8HP59_9BURK|nr:response regulator [Pseudoduganella umbonata]MBB3221026.1 CheY-like chemotaxis protein [Pseudoduganella umbonata]QCP10230.1 response regulator [Pseudoduganella umbonata]
MGNFSNGRGAARRILIVDDNCDAAELLAELMRLSGYEVDVAFSGASALQAVHAFQPDVVLLDLGMPGMDGYQVAQVLRATPGFTGLRIIALTAWGDAEARARTAASGFNLHLTKPAPLPALIGALDAG